VVDQFSEDAVIDRLRAVYGGLAKARRP